MADTAMFDFFIITICTREVPKEKSKGKQKCVTMEKIFVINPVYCFK